MGREHKGGFMTLEIRRIYRTSSPSSVWTLAGETGPAVR